MTAVPESLECGVERLLPDQFARTMPGADMFPPRFPGRASVTQILPGRDAADRSRCSPMLVETFSCDEENTWADPYPGDFVRTFRAARARTALGASATPPPPTIGSEPGAPKRRFSYTEYVLPAGDPGGAVGFQRRAFTKCAGAHREAPVGVPDVELRTAALGEGESGYDAALMVYGERIAMVLLTGADGRWLPAERAQAWSVAATHLKAGSD
jgi:hypothetical protein